MKTLSLKGKSSDSLINEIKKKFIIQHFDENNLQETTALIFDLKEPETIINKEHISYAIKFQVPILLINSDSNVEKMADAFGIGLSSRAVMVLCYDNHYTIKPMDNEIEEISDAVILEKIENGLMQENLLCLYKKMKEEKKKGLPAHQERKCTISYGPQKVTLHDNQIATNDIDFNIELYASFEPNYVPNKVKYLRISTGGTGFNPNKEKKGDITQELITLQMSPIISPVFGVDVRMIENSPENNNSMTTYTEETSFTVGVDIAKDPGFNLSWTETESKEWTINDYEIINKCSGEVAKWDFKINKNNSSSAESNLQPHCVAVWKVSDVPEFGHSVGFQCYARVNYRNFGTETIGATIKKPIYICFKHVSV
ncbi:MULTISPECIES: hypothetical protein [Psychrilyobacter]|uniref:Thiol-activated cytolysin n=1 Tax=Psychrilyobacter piezotolerans TaxID=2293438 RepID=A0ABX9KJ03_9FUSO|nr:MULTISPECIES: hypothetical protein [Psychrilyobacter]MCS5421735.1 hypothetical protein [Psychrilyobacter sp. S5]NDI77170.1 hypothetical protein [Psychrilyobacter piezotolerans]RDE64162.1 hypothetical protein DV867_04330 [Psychrilyobacter sp. S5]REI42254.1 hypothetical protein DYH56_04330 [Psychrilyobacter piezotolerans]